MISFHAYGTKNAWMFMWACYSYYWSFAFIYPNPSYKRESWKKKNDSSIDTIMKLSCCCCCCCCLSTNICSMSFFESLFLFFFFFGCYVLTVFFLVSFVWIPIYEVCGIYVIIMIFYSTFLYVINSCTCFVVQAWLLLSFSVVFLYCCDISSSDNSDGLLPVLGLFFNPSIHLLSHSF